MAIPQVQAIEGLPPAVALQQQRGTPTARSSVGSVTTLSNLLRMLYSRAGKYPAGQEIIYAEGFSPNTPQGACPTCHGLGRIYDVTERSAVPDDSLTIRQRDRGLAAGLGRAESTRHPGHARLRRRYGPGTICPKHDRDWILFTEEQPVVPVYAGFSPAETKAGTAAKRRTELHGDVHRRAAVRAAHLRNYAKPAMKKRACTTCWRAIARYATGSGCGLSPWP